VLRFATLAGALSVAGCFSSPVEDSCSLRCGQPGGCPDGYSCGADDHCHPADLASPRDCRAAAGDGAPCQPGPFAAADVVPGVNSASDDWGPALTADGRELYFASWRGPTSEIWVASRAGATGDFELPERVFAELTADLRDMAPAVTADGLALVFASNRGGAVDDLWIATREERGDPFGDPQPLGGVNEPESEWSPWLSSDRLRLYFASSRPGSVGFDIFLARRDEPDGPFRSPSPIADLSSDGADRWIRLSEDEREAFVASNRAGGEGNLDLYRFARAEPDGIFGDPEPLAALNTAGDDVGPFLSGDGRSLYVNTGADMSGGALADVSVAIRSCD
jgi:hypothetical protein